MGVCDPASVGPQSHSDCVGLVWGHSGVKAGPFLAVAGAGAYGPTEAGGQPQLSRAAWREAPPRHNSFRFLRRLSLR